MSWWPRASAWNSSGLNVDAWTEECEEWFIHRRNAILSGEAVPLNSHQWRSQMHFSRQSPKLMLKTNVAVVSYLESSQADFLTE